MIIKGFGYLLAIAVLATSVAMIVMKGRFQRIEQKAYAGSKRPWWFIALSALVIGLYLFALISFAQMADKTWPGWVLMVVIPIGYLLKAVLIVFNERGRNQVASIQTDDAWIKIALLRLPIAVLLALLASMT